MATKEEVKEQRKNLFRISERYHTFYKGDKRVGSPRICSVCGKVLSSLVVRENRYLTKHSHIRFHLNKHFYVNTCKDIESCYYNLNKKGELDHGNV